MRSTIERRPFERCGVRFSRKPDAVEQSERVGGQDLLRALAGIKRKQNGDQAAHDMGVAVAVEGERRAGGAVRLDMREQPDLAGAASHLVGLGVRAFGQRRQRAAELDDIAIAVVPLIEQREILNDVVDGGHAANI